MTEDTYTHDDVWRSCMDLSRTFPTIYSKPEALLCVSFGWHTLLYKYGPLLEEAALKAVASRTKEENEDYGLPTVCSAKQKYGRLDISINSGSEEIWDLISEIEDESLNVCEVCGNKAVQRETRGWITTLCDKHKN